MKVRELMTRDVASVRASEPASGAIMLMWEHDCGAIPVRADDSERLVGMVMDRDICLACWSQDRPPSTLLVADAMTNGIHACGPEDDLAAAETLMRARQIRRIPVIEQGRLVGILSLADIVRQAERREGRAPGLAAAEVTDTLADICHPRASNGSGFSG